MGYKPLNDRQVINSSALSTSIGSSAGASLDVILGLIDSKMVNLASPQTLTNKTLAFLQTNVITDSTTTGSAATLTSGDIADGVIRLTNASLVSVSGIPAGASGQFLTIENQTGNTITINNNDSGASAANRIFTGTGGNIQLSANATLSLVYDTTASRWMVNGGTGSGSGSGSGKNYLSVYTASTSGGVPNIGNGNAELGSITGWSLGTIGALTNGLPTGTPTFGSGASGNLTLGVVSSGQLAGSYSFSYASSAATTQGNMMASAPFFIDSEDQVQVLTFKMYYSTPVGSSNVNFSGTDLNSFGVAIWDVTNSVWIPASGIFGMTTGTGAGYMTGTFQTSTNTTQLRYVFYNVNATAGAVTVYLDDISVGPQTAPIGAVITDWIPYTPTITNLPGSILKAEYRRVGDSMQIYVNFLASGAATGNISATIPGGFTIDTTKIAGGGDTLGFAQAANGTGYSGIVYYDTPTTFLFVGPSSPFWGPTTPFTWANSNELSFQAQVPITGWTSNVEMSSSTDTRVIAASYYVSPSSYTPGAFQPMNFDTELYDTAGAVTTGTAWKFTAPVSGIYQISGVFSWVSTTGNIIVYKNGVSFLYMGNANNPFETMSQQLKLNAGDYIDIRSSNGSQAINGGSPPILSSININRLSGPSVIAATESINCSYNNVSGQNIPNNTVTVITNWTKEFDSHNAFNAVTGVYTVPASGVYSFSGELLFSTFTIGSGVEQDVGFLHNGILIGRSVAPFSSTDISSYGGILVKCAAGDTLSVSGRQTTGGSNTLVTDGTLNRMAIFRVGN
jgi:hypothetical protein